MRKSLRDLGVRSFQSGSPVPVFPPAQKIKLLSVLPVSTGQRKGQRRHSWRSFNRFGRHYIVQNHPFWRSLAFIRFFLCLRSRVFLFKPLAAFRNEAAARPLRPPRARPARKTARTPHHHLHWQRAGQHCDIGRGDFACHQDFRQYRYRHRHRRGHLFPAPVRGNHPQEPFPAVCRGLRHGGLLPPQAILQHRPTAPTVFDLACGEVHLAVWYRDGPA